MSDTEPDLDARIKQASGWINDTKSEMAQVLVGQDALVDRLLLGLLCHGHLLLEGVPGLAKTLSIRALGGCLDASFARVQFTPDLLPADLLGTMIYHPESRDFAPKLGPIFANLVLADEINRAPAKVQSALLEAMQERQVTIGDKSHPLPSPFLVLATQNPIDQEGTYQLPEAQLDRFLLKITVDYPTEEEELAILERMTSGMQGPETRQVATTEQVLQAKKLVHQVHIDPAVQRYIVHLVQATRDPEKIEPKLKRLIRAGASPRATINFALAGKAHAFMQGRAFVTPQDIKDLAHEILRHRLLLSYEAEAENISTDELISALLSRVPVP